MASITDTRHPEYLYSLPNWDTWRDIWEGGDQFVQRYLQKWSERESAVDFNRRRNITPVPGFAKAALVDIKNSVFHRMVDITRRGGSESYQKAIMGQAGGVDRRGASMNHFIGTQVLSEMLAMGKLGVYVDNIAPSGPTLADANGASPYLYTYRIEDIMSWQLSRPEEEGDFQAVLLRDWCVDYQAVYGTVQLPKQTFERYRLVWKGEDGYVWYQFFNKDGEEINPRGGPSNGATRLNLTKIPFVIFDIGNSLLKDISKHQIALLNLVSSDISYALKANFPFYIEQVDSRKTGSHLKDDIMEDGTASTGGQAANTKEHRVGSIDGRQYDLNTDAPSFINPSSEPLEASMNLQRKLEDDIRKLVNLAVISLGNSRASGEAKQIDNQGLESGLAFIGLVLEGGERKIADYWASYEGNSNKDAVIVKYPEQYRIKSQTERVDEAEKLTNLMFSIPGRTVKKELAKIATTALLGGNVPVEVLEKINKEIDTANYSTSNREVVELAKEQGLASDETLSDALGFDGKSEIPQARKDHALRVETIQKAQTSNDPGARGVPDKSANPQAGKQEKAAAKDNTLNDSTKSKERGKTKPSKKVSE